MKVRVLLPQRRGVPNTYWPVGVRKGKFPSPPSFPTRKGPRWVPLLNYLGVALESRTLVLDCDGQVVTSGAGTYLVKIESDHVALVEDRKLDAGNGTSGSVLRSSGDDEAVGLSGGYGPFRQGTGKHRRGAIY